MTTSIPVLSLSHGQVIWCLSEGKDASQILLDQIRYLRQLGIPFDEKKVGRGRGVRMTYDFYQFIEIGIAVEALKIRVQPRFLKMLIDERKLYQNLYKHAYTEIPQKLRLHQVDALKELNVYDDEIFLRFHDRYSETPGKITMKFPSKSEPAAVFGSFVEQDMQGNEHNVIALKATMAQLLVRAQNAPETRPGPVG